MVVLRRVGLQSAAVALLVLVASLHAAPRPALAQRGDEPPAALMLVMDSSGSMNGAVGRGGGTKLAAAKDALRAVVSELPDGVPTGLTVYGHRRPNDAPRARGCRDVEVVVPVAPLNRKRMTAAIQRYDASGYTPIGASLRRAADALPAAGARTIVLVSDGVDTCAPPAPCDVARRLVRQGIELTVETIGFQVDRRARRQLQCIAKVTGGQYRDADDAGSLANELVAVTARAVRDYETAGRRVEGGASYQEAPVLEAGTYSDTILAQEQLWYAVELAEGQALHAASTLVIGEGDFGGIGALYEIQLVGPLLEEMCCEKERGYEVNIGVAGNSGQRTVSIAARSEVVGAEGSNAEEAGTYYVRLTADGDGSGEYPVELTVDVVGGQAPQPTPSPTAPATDQQATATATPTPSPTPTPVATATGQQDLPTPIAAPGEEDSDALLIAVIALLALLVLALGAAVVVLWRRQDMF